MSNNDRDYKASMRGPNYDWETESYHYREECDKLRDLLGKIESSGEKAALERDDFKRKMEHEFIVAENALKELAVARERLGPAGYKIIQEVATLRAEIEDLKIVLSFPQSTVEKDLREHLARAKEAMQLTRARADDFADSWISQPIREALKQLDKGRPPALPVSSKGDQ